MQGMNFDEVSTLRLWRKRGVAAILPIGDAQ